ncbi:MAG: heavy metal translocating P-type ATPase, partial [Halobacteriaceae archaeon]
IDQLSELTTNRVDEARRRDGTDTNSVPVESLRPGDEVIIKQGERIPVDGIVIEGHAEVDESLITGESNPVQKEVSDRVIGGSVVVNGRLVLRVPEQATNTLDRIMRVLWDIQSSQPGVQRLADRIAAIFIPLVIIISLLSIGWHLFLGAEIAGALLIGLTVLVVSCPCALGLATPLAVSQAIQDSLDHGSIITDTSLFEKSTNIDIIAFDKTGTLTTGEMQIREYTCPDRILKFAAAVETYADHPIANAITNTVDPAAVSVRDFQNHPGKGVSAEIRESEQPTDDTSEWKQVMIGKPDLFKEKAISIPQSTRAKISQAKKAGYIPTVISYDGQIRGIVIVGDTPRSQWDQVIHDIGSNHEIVVITGDDISGTTRFRNHPKIDDIFTEVPPEGKSAIIEQLQAKGSVAMVGDGVNDAPALATADIGIAFDHAALSTDAADAVITDESLSSISRIFEITANTNRRIRQNLGWAFIYNGIALPLAFFGLLNPLFAAVAMASSSILVVANSSRSLVS